MTGTRPALIDVAPDPGNETPDVEEDFAAYARSRAMWSDTWTDLEFGPDEWTLYGERLDREYADRHARQVA